MKKYLPYILYAMIVGLIMKPFFTPGFLFLLDMAWTPNIQLSDYLSGGVSAGFPLALLLKFLSFLAPVEIIQKILLSLFFFLSGAFMYRFARVNNFGREWSFVAGLFYMLNPWVYERFLAGHWLIMLGYAFFPFVVALFLEFLKRPCKRQIIKLSLFLAVYPILSLHWAYIAYVFLSFCGFIYLWQEKRLSVLKNLEFVKKFLLILILIITVNSFWLFSFWGDAGVFPKITQNDFIAFETSTDTRFGVYFNVLSLYGFWNTAYFLPKDMFGAWWMLTIFFVGFSVLGAVYLIKKKNLFGLCLAIGFMPILILAVGYGSEFSKFFVNIFYYIMPGFKGLRETGKLTGLLAFSYALLVPIGMKYFFELCGYRLKEKSLSFFKFIAIFAVILIVFLSTMGIFNSFDKQLQTYEYPKSWFAVEEMLANNQGTKNVLVLPWCGYPQLDFAGNKRAVNPAHSFFSFDVVVGRNLENIFLMETTQAEWDDLIQNALNKNKKFDYYKDFLAQEDISHVLVLKIYNWKDYDFLNKAEILECIFDGEDAVVYKIK